MDKVQIDHIPMLRYTAGSTVRQEHQITADDLERINALAPESLRADQVYVRSMYLCSSLPCDADGCCFTRNALEQIAGKIVGQSVLAGHNRTRLPLARFFKAAVVQNGITEAVNPCGMSVLVLLAAGNQWSKGPAPEYRWRHLPGSLTRSALCRLALLHLSR